MFKTKIVPVILIVIFAFGSLFTAPASITQAGGLKDLPSIEVHVNKCNITVKKGTKDRFKFTYWGTASQSVYNLDVASEENMQKITVAYTGKGAEPGDQKGGLIIQVPDRGFEKLSITGKYSGITLDNMAMDMELNTRGSAVIMEEDNPGHIQINSTYDSYNINIAPITQDFYLKEKGSIITFQFNQEPGNLHLSITNTGKMKEKMKLPQNWSTDYFIGTGEPEMKIENNNGIFRLSCKDAASSL